MESNQNGIETAENAGFSEYALAELETQRFKRKAPYWRLGMETQLGPGIFLQFLPSHGPRGTPPSKD
jgi:hypothetical protein